ncbi:MAG: hypothetical protein JWM37_789 [Candidatus Saccharibacteria bacterium]|nr:hypothetical protein [Candidatus Saccharibacteria bacterium]
MTPYLEQLATDLIEIGFDTRVQRVKNFGDLHDLIGATRKIGRTSPNLDYEPTTELGQRVLSLCKEGPPFRTTITQCCIDAEPRLLSALNPAIVTNPNAAAPLLVTHEDEVCGVIKWQGDQTCFGLRDLPEFNLVANAFHNLPANCRLPQRPVIADHAVTVDIGDIGAMIPSRLSTLAVPLEERRALLTPDLPEKAVRVLTAEDGAPIIYSQMAFESAVAL